MMKAIGIMVSAVVGIAYACYLRGLTVSWLWEWYVRDLMGMRSITLLEGVGIGLLGLFICANRNPLPKYRQVGGTMEFEPVQGEFGVELLQSMVRNTVFCGVALAIGWLASR